MTEAKLREKDQIIASLRDELETLREELRQFKTSATQLSFPHEWKLTLLEQSILRGLYNAFPRILQTQSIEDLCGVRKEELANAHTQAQVMIHRIRKKIPKSIVIETVWGVGYVLTTRGKEQLSFLPTEGLL